MCRARHKIRSKRSSPRLLPRLLLSPQLGHLHALSPRSLRLPLPPFTHHHQMMYAHQNTCVSRFSLPVQIAQQHAIPTPPFLSKERQAHSMGDLCEQRKVEKKEARKLRHDEEKRLKEERKERRPSRSDEPPKVTRSAQSTSNLMEVMTDADVDREAKSQVFVWDPNDRALRKEKSLDTRP